MQNNQSRVLAYGAMSAVLFVILVLMTLFLPVVSVITLFLVPLPIAWYRTKFDRRSAIFVAVVSMLLGVLLGTIFAIPLVLSMALIGLFMGDFIAQKYSRFAIFVTTGIIIFVSTIAMYAVSIWLFNLNVVKELLSATRKQYEQMNEIFMKSAGQEAITPEMLDKTMQTFETLMPMMVIISTFLIAFVMTTVCLSLLKKLGVDVPKFPPFKDFRLPRFVLFAYLPVLAVKLFSTPEAGSSLDLFVSNIDLILNALFILQALSFIQYILAAKNISKYVGVLIFVILLPFLPLLVLLGILDLGFNIRGYITSNTKK
ncbi:hypothetical protein GCM10007425_23830 [Lysinibacillus alkalisoli]|uniref:DUF2232 domain-containing protein n=1 Tax=Lysinibacillus alkalisoli TaxID=1911548 RepID=A0A917LJ11_9BACI|nr:DUF2232 domain-containing protein [Lysinibacillus alkalisoli]GGG28422.1 hypothetical protein GCM10007425_23830 [Lysinibacillus alkalisoli]